MKRQGPSESMPDFELLHLLFPPTITFHLECSPWLLAFQSQLSRQLLRALPQPHELEQLL